MTSDITIRRPVEWVSYSSSNVGTVRTVNEDAVLEKPEIGLWVVADGMGGHAAGDVASQMIVESLAELERPDSLNDFVLDVERRIKEVNDRLLEYSEIMLDGHVSGSTVACLLIYGQAAVPIWMGDSRLYLYRGSQLQQITRDHSHVSELLQSGAITEAEAINHPESNVITRAVGTSDTAFLDFDVFDVQLGDVMLLCSDGLYNAVNSDDIRACLENGIPQNMVNKLINTALENGAKDNVSVIAVKGSRPRVNCQAAQ